MGVKSDKKIKIIDYTIFGIFAAGMTVLLLILAHNQAINTADDNYFNSDILAYMQEALGIDSGYSYPYPIFFALIRFFHLFLPIEWAAAVAESFLNLLALVATKLFLNRYLFKKKSGEADKITGSATHVKGARSADGTISERTEIASENNETCRINDCLGARICATIFALTLFMLSMVIAPYGVHLPLKKANYYGIFSGNPWHNATYIATRPFAIAAFFFFADLLESYEKKFDLKTEILFSVFLLLTTMTKPSFTLVFGSTAAVVLIFRLIKSKFKNFKNTLWVVLAFVPTIIDLLYQYSGVFTSASTDAGDEHGIGFVFFDVWERANQHILAGVVYANVFALICLLIFFRDFFKDKMYRFSVLFFLVSFLEAGLLCEKGFRYGHFNFSWGYMHGIFFFELIAMFKMVRATLERSKKLPVLAIGWLAYTVQLASGIGYFAMIFMGTPYD